MKKTLLLFFFFSPVLFAGDYNSALESARILGEKGIIVDQSIAAGYNGSDISLDFREASMYRLNDFLARQEAIKIALNLRGVQVPPSYSCRGYFSDIFENWACRVVEFAADYSIVTRVNSRFRPLDSLTLAESLKIVMVGLQIPLTTSDPQIIPGNIPQWQKHIILTLRERGINFDLYDSYGNSAVRMFESKNLSMSVEIPLLYKMTRGAFFQLVTSLMQQNNQASCYDYRYSSCPSTCQAVCRSSSGNGDIGTADCEGINSCIPKTESATANCTVYNDGCNDCIAGNVGDICTKRACFSPGVPSCSICKNGYTLQNSRCILDTVSCKQLGESVSNFSLPPEYQFNGTCCIGLTSVSQKNGGVGGANICANVGDGYCDSRYESTLNSLDCRVVGFDDSICQSYYDGCNNCSKSSNGQTVCTMMYCPALLRPSYCTAYVSYTPISQTSDSLFLGKVLQEIRDYTSDLSCTNSSQCQWKMMGSTPCGGPSVFVSYSTKNIDTGLMDRKSSDYTAMQTFFNRTYPVFGTCMVMTSPAPLSCVSGQCNSSY